MNAIVDEKARCLYVTEIVPHTFGESINETLCHLQVLIDRALYLGILIAPEM